MKYIIINILLLSFIFSNTFKNVKVLEIDSRTEMKKYMKSISKDLGVKCSHCHDMDDKSIDTSQKDIAREMIKLTKKLKSPNMIGGKVYYYKYEILMIILLLSPNLKISMSI